MSSPQMITDIPKQQLSLFDSVCIIVGTIIGVGIFETTPRIAGAVGGPLMLLAVWVVGGLLALAGALCFAELTTAYPKEGGDYVFLTKAFGPRIGFLFVWAQFWIIRPGNIGAMGFVFARYANQLIPWELGQLNFVICACAAVALLAAINVLGVYSGKWTQNVLTVAKVGGLLVVVVAAFFSPTPTVDAETTQLGAIDLRFAMIMVLFTYGGWNDVSFVAAEVRRPRKNLLRALLLGTATVMAIYILVNLAFLRGLGFPGVATSQAVAADLMQLRFGNWGGKAISVLVCVSSLGAINGMTLTGARVFYVLGTEHRLFAWLGKWNGRVGAPIRALVGQATITLVLVIAFGFYQQGFQRMVIFSTPFFWFFLFLVGVALVVLRRRDPQAKPSFRVVFYPFTPLIFWLTCLFMVYSSTDFACRQGYIEGLWAVLLMGAGLLVALATGPAGEPASS